MAMFMFCFAYVGARCLSQFEITRLAQLSRAREHRVVWHLSNKNRLNESCIIPSIIISFTRLVPSLARPVSVWVCNRRVAGSRPVTKKVVRSTYTTSKLKSHGLDLTHLTPLSCRVELMQLCAYHTIIENKRPVNNKNKIIKMFLIYL